MEKPHLLSRRWDFNMHEKLPLVELAGSYRILIENHTGVLSYSQEEIAVRVNYGFLRILGQDMKLAEMHYDQLVISGQIDSVLLHRR